MAPERCAWSGGEGKRLVEGVLSVPRAERAHRGRRLRLDLGGRLGVGDGDRNGRMVRYVDQREPPERPARNGRGTDLRNDASADAQKGSNEGFSDTL